MTRPDLLMFVLLAVVVRAAGWQAIDNSIAGDAVGYQRLANNLREHGVFSLDEHAPFEPSMLRPPLFPAFVAATQATGHLLGIAPLLSLQLAQLLVSICTVILLIATARRLFGRRIGTVCATALALNPFDGPFVASILTETLSSLFVASIAASLVLLKGTRRFVFAGCFAGLAALTRDLFVILPLVVAGSLMLSSLRGRRRGLKAPALLLVSAALVILPWSIRNLFSLGRLAPVASGGIEYNAWIGSWEESANWTAGGSISFPPSAFPTLAHKARLESLHAGFYDTEARELFREMAVLNWSKDPLGTVIRCIKRMPQTWLGTRTELFSYRLPGLSERGSPAWRVAKSCQWSLNGIFIAFGAAFFVFAPRLGLRARYARSILAPPVILTLVSYFPMHSVESRYSQPVLQLFIVGFGVVATHLTVKAQDRLRSRSSSKK